MGEERLERQTDNLKSLPAEKDWMKKLKAATGRPLQLEGDLDRRRSLGAERRKIQFICALKGKAFDVLLIRSRRSNKFRIEKVVNSSPAPSQSGEGNMRETEDASEKPLDAVQFDWTGWFCPHCGHNETFVKCGTCGDYVCGGSMRELADGTRVHTCHKKCGATGEVEGHIESYMASAEHAEHVNARSVLGPSTRKSLPKASRRCLPPNSD